MTHKKSSSRQIKMFELAKMRHCRGTTALPRAIHRNFNLDGEQQYIEFGCFQRCFLYPGELWDGILVGSEAAVEFMKCIRQETCLFLYSQLQGLYNEVEVVIAVDNLHRVELISLLRRV